MHLITYYLLLILRFTYAIKKGDHPTRSYELISKVLRSLIATPLIYIYLSNLSNFYFLFLFFS